MLSYSGRSFVVFCEFAGQVKGSKSRNFLFSSSFARVTSWKCCGNNVHAQRSFATKVPLELIKELRKRTSVPINDCREALIASEGDVEKAIIWLRKNKSHDFKDGRTTAEGLLAVASSGNRGVIVEINSETDFVARNEAFQKLLHDVTRAALQLPARPSISAEIPLQMLLEAPIIGGTTASQSVAEVSQWLQMQLGEKITIRRAHEFNVTNGVVAGYLHGGGIYGSLVALSTDSNPPQELRAFAEQLAVHVVAYKPKFITKEEVTEDVVTNLKESNPKFDKEAFITESVLMEQECYINGEEKKTKDAIEELKKKLNTSFEVKEFLRWERGEGIEKKTAEYGQQISDILSKQ